MDSVAEGDTIKSQKCSLERASEELSKLAPALHMLRTRPERFRGKQTAGFLLRAQEVVDYAESMVKEEMARRNRACPGEARPPMSFRLIFSRAQPDPELDGPSEALTAFLRRSTTKIRLVLPRRQPVLGRDVALPASSPFAPEKAAYAVTQDVAAEGRSKQDQPLWDAISDGEKCG